jgi:hypothetical protein
VRLLSASSLARRLLLLPAMEIFEYKYWRGEI